MSMTPTTPDSPWKPCPEGQILLDQLLAAFLDSSPRTAALAQDLRHRTGTRLFDWIDHFSLPDAASLRSGLAQAGFTADGEGGAPLVWEHHDALFPRVRLHPGPETILTLKVESLADFLAAQAIPVEPEGLPHSQLRLARAWSEGLSHLHVIERHGWRGFSPPPFDLALAIESQSVLERFRRRPRHFHDDDLAAFTSLHRLLDSAIATLGRDWTSDLWFAAERDFWMRRNRAGRFQKARQDQLGFGWANHDHHTYRCRRQTFHQVIAIFEKLGFTLRERFYAGAEAGWGAQIVEHQATGITVFADVDMSPEEISGDFAHQGLPPRPGFGTVGLWCELHGDSLFEAGMHHLEAQFDFDLLREQMLAGAGIPMMKPFTDFAVLRQQFSEGERWPVSESRLRRLLDSGDLTPAQAGTFRQQGATGSHLENLQRNAGYKGFNQSGISDIITRTDPRRLSQPA